MLCYYAQALSSAYRLVNVEPCMPTLAECLRDAAQFFNRHILSLALLTLPLGILASLLVSYLTPVDPNDLQPQDLIGPVLISVAANALSTAAVVFFMAGKIFQQPIGIGRAYQAAAAVFVGYSALSMLETLLVMAGLSFFIIPGLYMVTRFSYTAFEFLLHRQSVWQSLARSWQLSGDNLWYLFCGNTSVWFFTYLASANLQKLAPDNVALQVFSSGLETLFGTFCVVFAYRVYDAQLRRGMRN